MKGITSFRAFRVLLRKDLQREFRTKEMLSSMGIYALLVLIIYGATLAQVGESVDIVQMSGGLIWTLIVFTSMMGLNRSFTSEKENGCLEGLLLVPMDRGAIYLAKATSNALFLLIVEIIALPLFFFFFMGGVSVASTLPLVVAPLLLGTIGMACVGTLLSAITAHVRSKDVMLAVLFVPLIFPLLYACVTATTALIAGFPGAMDVVTPSLAIVLAYDVIMGAVCWVLFDFVISS